MTDDTDEQLASLGEPEHTVRERLRADPDTQEIAKALGVDVDEYITQVIFYARRPNLAPQVEVIDDADLEGVEGADLPTEGEVYAWLDAVERGEVDLGGDGAMTQTSEFTTERDRAEKIKAAMGARMERRAPTLQKEGPPKPSSVLQQQLLEQQRQARTRAEGRRAAPTPKPDKKD